MNKEEQQQALYKTLLQRNQFNSDVIRKFRKKSKNFQKKTAQLNEPARVDSIELQKKTGENENKTIVQSHLNSCIDSEYFNSKQVLKLPNINVSTLPARNQNEVSRTAGETTRKTLGIRAEVSISIACSSVQKKAKTLIQQSQNFELSMIRQVQKENTGEDTKKKSIRGKQSVITHSVRSTNTNLQNNNGKSTYKRQARISNSHKTLLNLQQITFEGNTKKIINNPYAKGYRQKEMEGQNQGQYALQQKQLCTKGQKKNSKQKARKYCKFGDKLSQKQNIDVLYDLKSSEKHVSVEGLNNITSFMTNTCLLNSSNLNLHLNHNSNNNNISSLSISSISQQINQNSVQMNVKNSKVVNQQGENQGIGPKNSLKQYQQLPHIRKFKQLRLNFYKLAKKETNNCPDYTNPNHNYTYSLNNIGIGSCSGLQQIDANQRKVFKIQAIPVHQIKWI